MEKETKSEKKPNGFTIFLEEIQRSSWIVTFLAIITGVILGGILAAVTSLEVYAAFKVSFWEGLRTALSVAGSTYSALFTGSVGDFGKIKTALELGNPLDIRRAFFPFFESLVQSTPYIFGGLAVAVGFRAGQFNIGAEGQIFIGALTGAWAGYSFPEMPAIIHVPFALLCGFLGGA